MDVNEAAHAANVEREPVAEPEPLRAEFQDSDGWIWCVEFNAGTAFVLRDEHGVNPFARDLLAEFKALEADPLFFPAVLGICWTIIERQKVTPRRPDDGSKVSPGPASVPEDFHNVMAGEQIEQAYRALMVAFANFGRQPALLRLLTGPMRAKQEQLATAVLDRLESQALDVDTNKAADEVAAAILTEAEQQERARNASTGSSREDSTNPIPQVSV